MTTLEVRSGKEVTVQGSESVSCPIWRFAQKGLKEEAENGKSCRCAPMVSHAADAASTYAVNTVLKSVLKQGLQLKVCAFQSFSSAVDL